MLPSFSFTDELADEFARQKACKRMHDTQGNSRNCTAWLTPWNVLFGVSLLIIPVVAILWSNIDCYQLGSCYSKSLPSVDRFVGREEDIHNITGYLDFYHSDVQVVHIVGSPGFGKSTLAKKIGEVLVRKRVNVHYVDVNSVTDIDTLAEKMMLSISESISNKVTFDRLEKWVRNQYTSTLIILDNCDELFEHTKEEFLDAIKRLTAVPTKSVRYLLTSQRRITDIGNFRLHHIYILSTEASIQLLGKVAPGLTHDQMIQIANLTGNVPLALDIVGAIFNYPDPPTVEEVIQGLRDNLVDTLSPLEVHSKVDASIGLAFSYLTPELKQLCVNLSQFPGTFTRESAFNVSGYDVEFNYFDKLVKTLKQRSLLHFNRAIKQCHFHQLLKAYFLQQTKEKALKQHFDGAFQLYYAQTLHSIINDYERHLALHILDVERHNFHHMFSLFKTSKHVNYTFFGVTVALDVLKLDMLELRFMPMGIMTYSLYMLEALDSYTDDEVDSIQPFFETYTKVVILVAEKQLSFHKKPDIALKTLQSKQGKVDEGYKRKLVSQNLYRRFYFNLAVCYEKKGDDVKLRICHTRILETYGQLEHCFPECNYFSISIAYNNIGDQHKAFRLRRLAYAQQLTTLSRMEQAFLSISLYNDYSNVVLGNNINKANELSSIIEEDVYHYLMTADILDYAENVYLIAIQFFQDKTNTEKAAKLEHKMLDADQSTNEQCVRKKTITCGDQLINSARTAWSGHFYYRAIWLANASFDIYHGLQLPRYEAESSTIIGFSLYEIGNYSQSQIWLKRALLYANQDLKSQYSQEMRKRRLEICGYLLAGGDIFNVFCYGYILKNKLASAIWEDSETQFDFEYPKEQTKVTSSTEIQQKNSYSIIRSSVDKIFATRLHNVWSAVFKVCGIVITMIYFVFKVCGIVITCIKRFYIMVLILSLCNGMHFAIAFIILSCICCSVNHRDDRLCICLVITYATTITMFVFLLALD